MTHITKRADSTFRFTIHPVVTSDGILYIVKEYKLFGKYLKQVSGGSAFTLTNKEQATRWDSILNVNKSLYTTFGNDFTIVDNYI